MSHPNADSYQTIGWILNQSNEGFYLIIASERMQQEVAALYADSNVALYDYKKELGAYSIATTMSFVEAHPLAKAYFFVNFQLALPQKEDFDNLNFSRDMLMRLGKNMIFCLTQEKDDTLARSAYDFYSFIKLRVFFEDESMATEDMSLATPKGFDLSTGVVDETEIDYSLPKYRLLAQAISLANQAKKFADEYRYSDGLVLLHKALEIRERLLGKEHPDTADTYSAIGGAYEGRGDYEIAKEWYHKALEIRELALGIEHPKTATAYNNIARVFYAQGDYPQALEWYQKDLAIREKVLGKEHPETATTYNDMALVYDSQGNYPQALEWHQKALVIREKVLGKEHPETAITYSNIALVIHHQGNYPLALEWYQKALAIREKVLGKEHPATATTYNNIAGVYSRQGNYPQALEWHQKALATREMVLGKEHPATAATYNNIAWVYSDQGNHSKALEWFRRALTIREKVLSKDHPDTKATQAGIEAIQKADRRG